MRALGWCTAIAALLLLMPTHSAAAEPATETPLPASGAWTARPDGLYSPAGQRVSKSIDDAFKRSDFTRKERRALIFAAIGVAADVYTTQKGLKGGRCKEANSWIYGKDPSTAKLGGVGLAQLGLLYWFMQRDDADYSRAGYVTGGVRFAAAAYNHSLDCE
jgi:hypothetical protein